jgi:DNA polymerase III subunit beta
MKETFKIEQRALLSMLSSMQPICSKKTTLDVTESILFQIAPRELTLKSTDLEISLQSSAAIESSLTEPMSFLIAGKRIFELVKELDGDISCTIEDNQLRLQSGGVDLELNIRDAQDFPPFPERIENLMNIETSFLQKLLNKVSFVIPNNNANAALNGMLFECDDKGMTLVATDGHSLARIKSDSYTLADAKKWLLPKRAVLELKKILDGSDSEQVFVGECGSQLVFSGTHFNFFTKLIADKFPQYQPVLDKEGFRPAVVAKSVFSKTLKRAGCLLSGQFVSTNFTFKPGTIDISLHNKEIGKLDESIGLDEFAGEHVESKFYSPYLLNGLQIFGEEKINFLIKNSAKPIIFETESDDFTLTYLVMPVFNAQQ